MGYRIRYEVRARGCRWLALAAAGVTGALMTKAYWYWEFARYVGEAIRGAG